MSDLKYKLFYIALWSIAGVAFLVSFDMPLEEAIILPCIYIPLMLWISRND